MPEKEEPAPVQQDPAEEVKGDMGESHRFEAETRQLLDIVAKSLYTDKEVFIRELVSNASDALEKRRHYALTTGDASADSDALEVRISCDSATRTLVVQDNGIGMGREDIVDNLGCIARSGSKAFLQSLGGDDGTQSADSVRSAASSIIGRFGVGFYSVFMVADSVRVFTRPAGATEPEGEGFCWESTGDGAYTLSPASHVKTGTKVVIKLKEGCSEFAHQYTLDRILRKHSSFVSFPVLLHGERVNTVEPLWMKSKSSVTAEEHTQLYRHLGDAYDDPRCAVERRIRSRVPTRWHPP